MKKINIFLLKNQFLRKKREKRSNGHSRSLWSLQESCNPAGNKSVCKENAFYSSLFNIAPHRGIPTKNHDNFQT